MDIERPAHILVVDDQPENLRLIAQMLQHAGYTIRLARDGAQAIASAQAVPPDLVLLDIMMPDMDGYAVCETLKADTRTRQSVVIFISALNQAFDKVRAFQVGGVDYITKPFQVDEVLARVATHLTLQQVQQQLQARNAQLAQEIAERRQVEEAYRNLVEYSLQGLVIVQDERFVFANPAMADILGYTPEELQAMQPDIIARLVHPDDQALVRNYTHLREAGLAAPTRYEVRLIHKDTTIRRIETFVASVTYRGKRAIQVAYVDITERRQAEDRLIQQQQALAMYRERERLAREMHDTVGQVLGYVHTQAQVMREQLTNGQTVMIDMNLERLIEVTRETSTDLRSFILGVQVGDTLKYGFFPSIERYLERYEQIYGIRCTLTVASDLAEYLFPPVVEAHLVRIIQEALSNIHKHAGASTAAIVFERHAEQLLLIIEDNGIGFDPTLLLADNARGFGLRSMRERVAEINGTIEIHADSQLDSQGTRLLIHIPLHTGNAQNSASLSVLLVDDQPLFLEGMQNMLVSRGMTVLGTANNGLEAIKEAHRLCPDVILMDVDMPVCNGLEATRRIKAELPDIKIVMLSVSADDGALFEAIKSGASGYLLKNLDVSSFFALLSGLERDEVALSPEMAQKLLREFARPYQPDAVPSPDDRIDTSVPHQPEADTSLTDLERDVLSLVAQGHTYRATGERIGYSERTIKNIMSGIIKKLHLKNRAAAIAYARKIGL